jgi:hypothetical protein
MDVPLLLKTKVPTTLRMDIKGQRDWFREQHGLMRCVVRGARQGFIVQDIPLSTGSNVHVELRKCTSSPLKKRASCVISSDCERCSLSWVHPHCSVYVKHIHVMESSLKEETAKLSETIASLVRADATSPCAGHECMWFSF